MKDNFSTQSDHYAKYRPTYPSDFFQFIKTKIQNPKKAWDCGTGNGQVAFELANFFEVVFATDISKSQIDNALKADNIFYSVQSAERTNFQDHTFDLIVVAQAIHWFDFDQFYKEVKRTAKDKAIICVVGYSLLKISEPIDKIITDFYLNIIGKYWDKERKYLNENYQTIPFPFDEFKTPNFAIEKHWDLEHLIGYINTWSAVKHFIEQNNYNPTETLQKICYKFGKKTKSKKLNFLYFYD